MRVTHLFSYSRLSPLKEVLKTLEKCVIGLSNQQQKVANIEPDQSLSEIWLENLQQQTEEIYGAACVMSQSYLKNEVAWIFGTTAEAGVRLQSKSGITWSKLAESRVQLIYELANLYKHSSEWHKENGRWKINNRNKKTIRILHKFGINETVFLPCSKGIEVITEKKPEKFFEILYGDLSQWRNALILKHGGEPDTPSW